MDRINALFVAVLSNWRSFDSPISLTSLEGAYLHEPWAGIDILIRSIVDAARHNKFDVIGVNAIFSVGLCCPGAARDLAASIKIIPTHQSSRAILVRIAAL